MGFRPMFAFLIYSVPSDNTEVHALSVWRTKRISHCAVKFKTGVYGIDYF